MQGGVGSAGLGPINRFSQLCHPVKEQNGFCTYKVRKYAPCFVEVRNTVKLKHNGDQVWGIPHHCINSTTTVLFLLPSK